MTWQPIETAPKDGTEIILGGKGWSHAGFHSGDVGQMRLAEPGWFFEDDRGNMLTARNIEPTHWQPLPTPPE